MRHATQLLLPLRPLLLLAALALTLPPAQADESVPPNPFPAESGGAAPAPSNLPPPTSRRVRGTPPAGSVELPGGSATPTAPAGTPSAPVRREVQDTGIVELRTTDDLALTGGGSAVQLVVRFRVVRDDGRHFYVNALFFDRSTGQALVARREAFADAATGALYVISQPAVHAGGDREYEVALQVPHDAFPQAPAGGSMSVETRVSLFRRSHTGGMDESMDWTTAVFAVHGAAPAAAPAASPSVPATPPMTFPAPAVEAAPLVVRASDGQPPAAAPTAASPVGATGSTRIVSITKNHNQQVSDGRLELWLPVRYRAVGEAGRSFYVQAVFLDRASGQPVASVRSAFADRTTGALYVLTQPVAHGGGSTEYEATLRVPYDAFPRPAAGATASIEARITLFRRDLGGGMDASMDVSSVTFNVHAQ